MLTLINADAEDDEDAEITDPLDVAQLFCALAETALEMLGADEVRALLAAVIEQQGRELN